MLYASLALPFLKSALASRPERTSPQALVYTRSVPPTHARYSRSLRLLLPYLADIEAPADH